jgi:hypothetical protein
MFEQPAKLSLTLDSTKCIYPTHQAVTSSFLKQEKSLTVGVIIKLGLTHLVSTRHKQLVIFLKIRKFRAEYMSWTKNISI